VDRIDTDRWLTVENYTMNLETLKRSYEAAMVRRTFFLRIMLPVHEFNHLPPSSAKVNEWSCTSTPCVCLHNQHRDNSTSLIIP
jgi:hypothetical protein